MTSTIGDLERQRGREWLVGRFQFGQIIEAYISDRAGRVKERLALMISSDADNDQGLDLLVLAITKSIDHPCPAYHVLVHRDWTRDPATGLNAPCVVKCNWVRNARQDKVIRSLGYMSDNLLEVIVGEFDKIQADESFTNWL
jgi:mRNA-degrading endonuclease toxin of MazEF toxin-antitoxin module